MAFSAAQLFENVRVAIVTDAIVSTGEIDTLGMEIARVQTEFALVTSDTIVV